MCKGVILSMYIYIYIHHYKKNELSFTYLLANLYLVICGGTKKKTKKTKKTKQQQQQQQQQQN